MFPTSILKFATPTIAASLATVVVVLAPAIARGEAAFSSRGDSGRMGNWVGAPHVGRQNQSRTGVGRIKIIERAEDQQSCRNTLFVPARPRKCHGDSVSPEIASVENAQASNAPVQETPLRNPKKEVVEAQSPPGEKAPALKSTARLNVEPKDIKPEFSVNPKPVQPQALEKDQPQSPSILSCNKAATIVGGYGFTGVTSSDCDGQVYSFNASRDGKPFMITLNSNSGELIKVRKVP